jgi:hypothetical protein
MKRSVAELAAQPAHLSWVLLSLRAGLGNCFCRWRTFFAIQGAFFFWNKVKTNCSDPNQPKFNRKEMRLNRAFRSAGYAGWRLAALLEAALR